MLLALASVCVLPFLFPDIKRAAGTASFTFFISSISAIKLTRIYVQKTQEKFQTVKKVIRGYRAGAITRRTLVDFALFKFRMWISHHLENGLLTSHSSGCYDLVYYDGDRKFRVRFPKNRGVRQITNVSLHGDIDVTEEFLEFLGPGCNFHGISTTPKLLGFEDDIVVTYRCGTKLTYHSTSVIYLNPPV